MKQIITTKKGTTYEREVKEPNDYNIHINIRANNDKFNKFKEVTSKKGLCYSDVIRNLMDKYAEENEGE